ncbi:MAG TPA: glutathione S-transferase family protein [Xanthobacteraceae bacterium]|nr:glutathione S-transferase family protein [Xanthobacteraceae bacterium]
MGHFLDGVWHDDAARTDSGGAFQRPTTTFRNHVTADGSPGTTGDGGFRAEAGRYHLYVSRACPWAHRTLIFRKLKRLEDVISVSVVSPDLGKEGWTFDRGSGSTGDPVNGAAKLADIYLMAEPRYSGRVTVPVLWDKQRRTIVSNESAEIIRMLNSAFDAFTSDRADYYPPALRDEIGRINERVYATVNNGVYRCGFATTQQAYDDAFTALFATLDELERRLERQRYLAGSTLTEADWRLFTTLVRFDAVYYVHFKCNKRRIVDYPNLSNYLRALYQIPGVAETVSIPEIKRHYYRSHRQINPSGIIPLGPDLDFNAPHDRGRFG